MGEGSQALKQFCSVKHTREKVNDDVYILAIAIHEDVHSFMPDGEESAVRGRYSRSHVVNFIDEHAAFYGHRLRKLVLDDQGHVLWGARFGWFILIANPDSADAYTLRFISGQEMVLPEDIANAGSGTWTIAYNWSCGDATLSRHNFDRPITKIFADAGISIGLPIQRRCPKWLEALLKERKSRAGEISELPTPQAKEAPPLPASIEDQGSQSAQTVAVAAAPELAPSSPGSPPPPPGMGDPLGSDDED
jgi:hypothetical protein